MLHHKAPVTPTAKPKPLYNAQKICQHTVGSPQNMPKSIIFASYIMHGTSLQQPHDVPTASFNGFMHPRRSYSMQEVAAACSLGAYIILMALIQHNSVKGF